MRSHLVRSACLVVVLLGLSVPLALGAVKQLVASPPRTDAGNWDGTWMYQYRDARVALWLRTRDERPELKIRFKALYTPEKFETDWDGAASYEMAGNPGTYKIELSHRDSNTLEGTLDWQVTRSDGGRTETGRFTIYRAGDGRRLVFRFDEYEKVLKSGQKTYRLEATPVWVFHKASKRLVRWEELPF